MAHAVSFDSGLAITSLKQGLRWLISSPPQYSLPDPSASKGAFAASLICGLGLDTLIPQVENSASPPHVKSAFKGVFIPKGLPVKTRHGRKRSGSGGAGDEKNDDGLNWRGDQGGDSGSGSGPGSGGGFWGSGGWNRDDRDENWNGDEANGDRFGTLYDAACWISLTQCVVHAFKGLAHKEDSPNDPSSPFAYCSSSFIRDAKSPPSLPDLDLTRRQS